MNAQVLLEAAAVIRERAEAADDSATGGTFDVRVSSAVYHGLLRTHAEHACAWTPAVALALADLLEHAARNQVAFTPNVRPLITAIAAAYLGEQDCGGCAHGQGCRVTPCAVCGKSWHLLGRAGSPPFLCQRCMGGGAA